MKLTEAAELSPTKATLVGLHVGGLGREVDDARQQRGGLGVRGRGRLEDVLVAAPGDEVGVGQREPRQLRALRHLGDREREARQPAADAADHVGLLRHQALRRVLGLLRGVAGVVEDQLHLGATEGLDAARLVHVLDGHLGAHLLEDALTRPGPGQRDDQSDLHFLRRLRARAAGRQRRRGGGGEAHLDGGPASDRLRRRHVRSSPSLVMWWIYASVRPRYERRTRSSASKVSYRPSSTMCPVSST